MITDPIAVYIIAVNALAWVLYGVDKRRALRGQWRIRELTLLSVCALGGSLGALLGMITFHHKTRKTKFKIIVPLCLLAHIMVLGYYGFVRH